MSKNVYVNNHLYFVNEGGDMYLDGAYMGHIYNDDHRKAMNTRYLRDAAKSKQNGVVVESMSLDRLIRMRESYMNCIDKYVNYVDRGWREVNAANGRYEACVKFLNTVIQAKGGKPEWVFYQP